MLSEAAKAAIKEACRDQDVITLHLAYAIAIVESGGDQWAWDPEPRYRHIIDAATSKPFRSLSRIERMSAYPPEDFVAQPGIASDADAEWWGQRASWGLFQVMGAVAREYGFREHFPALCDLRIGSHYGVRHLVKLHNRFYHRGGLDAVIASYNAGSPRYDLLGRLLNADYVDRVRTELRSVES